MARAKYGLRRFSFRFLIGGLLLVSGCAKDQTTWIQIGKTTKAEVLERYGEPDLVRTSPEGATASYRPRASRQAPPPVEIPIARAGPFGLAIFRTEAVTPGLRGEDVATGQDIQPNTQLQIRYDERDIVREVRQ